MAVDVKSIIGSNNQDKAEQDIYKVVALARSQKESRLREERYEQLEVNQALKNTSDIITTLLSSIGNHSTEEQIGEIRQSIESAGENEVFQKSALSGLVLTAALNLVDKKASQSKMYQAGMEDITRTGVELDKLQSVISEGGVYNNEGLLSLLKDMEDSYIKNAGFLESEQMKAFESLRKEALEMQHAYSKIYQFDSDLSTSEIDWKTGGKYSDLTTTQKRMVALAKSAADAGDYTEANDILSSLDTQFAMEAYGSSGTGGVIKDSLQFVTSRRNDMTKLAKQNKAYDKEFGEQLLPISNSGVLNVENANIDTIKSSQWIWRDAIAGLLLTGESEFFTGESADTHAEIMTYINTHTDDDGNIDLNALVKDLDFYRGGAFTGVGHSSTEGNLEHSMFAMILKEYRDMNTFINFHDSLFPTGTGGEGEGGEGGSTGEKGEGDGEGGLFDEGAIDDAIGGGKKELSIDAALGGLKEEGKAVKAAELLHTGTVLKYKDGKTVDARLKSAPKEVVIDNITYINDGTRYVKQDIPKPSRSDKSKINDLKKGIANKRKSIARSSFKEEKEKLVRKDLARQEKELQKYKDEFPEWFETYG